MPDYGVELRFGSFITPASNNPEQVMRLARLSEELGLDLVTFQDHPYQPALLDTWTLLSYVAAATVQISIAPNVLNLPLRPPAVVARGAATLDLLSGGRVELGLGAGAFWDGVAGMGGERLSPGESVVALEEAIQVIRQLWDTSSRGGARLDGDHYRLQGAKRGPRPVHDIEIWLGALKPRMLRLTGRVADGWLPSSAYLPPSELAAAHQIIDEAALAAGRRPADVRRLYNLSGSFTSASAGFLVGPADQWVEELTELAVSEGISTFILASDDATTLSTFAAEVTPAVREAVAAERARPTPSESARTIEVTSAGVAQPVAVREPAVAATAEHPAFPVAPTADDGARLTEPVWDETTRPSGPAPEAGRHYAPAALASAQQLVDIHQHLRLELSQIRDLVAQVIDGTTTASSARSAINEMTLRQNNWTVGAYCAAYRRLVTTHHSIEDQALFPQLRRSDPRLTPVVDRLHAEHEIIHQVLDGVDRALVAFVSSDADHTPCSELDQLTDSLLSHLAYEERELLEPLARLNILV